MATTLCGDCAAVQLRSDLVDDAGAAVGRSPSLPQNAARPICSPIREEYEYDLLVKEEEEKKTTGVLEEGRRRKGKLLLRRRRLLWFVRGDVEVSDARRHSEGRPRASSYCSTTTKKDRREAHGDKTTRDGTQNDGDVPHTCRARAAPSLSSRLFGRRRRRPW